MNSANWWHLLAGVALFIFAMSLLEDALRELAGRRFKQFLQRQTSHKLRAIAGGTVVTAFLQSSSIVLLMVLSFVGAGVMSMRNAIAVTLGANLGTTLDSWVVATLGFKVALDAISYPLLAIALLIKVIFPANNNIRYLTQFIIGFSLLFIGLEWMKVSVMGLVAGVDVARYAHLSPYLFIPLGILVTAIIQSSSATMAITLTALYHHVIPFESATCVVIGSELGTTLKILLGSLGGMPDKKRVSLGNFIFNVIVVILATIFLYQLIYLIRNWLHINDPLIALVAFQTIINVIAIIAFYPFISRFADVLEKLYKKRDDEATKYIHKGVHFEGVTLQAAEKETLRFIMHAIRFNSKVLGLAEAGAGNDSFLGAIKKFAFEPSSTNDEYKKLKELHGEILEFLVGINAAEMKPEEIEYAGKLISILRHVIHAAKNLKDISHNIRDVGASGNDTLYEIYVAICERERVFYSALHGIIDGLEKGGTPAAYELLLQQREPDYKSAVDSTLGLLNKGNISDIDASTLLNMHREIYSSHKALLKAIELFSELGTGSVVPVKP